MRNITDSEMNVGGSIINAQNTTTGTPPGRPERAAGGTHSAGGAIRIGRYQRHASGVEFFHGTNALNLNFNSNNFHRGGGTTTFGHGTPETNFRNSNVAPNAARMNLFDGTTTAGHAVITDDNPDMRFDGWFNTAANADGTGDTGRITYASGALFTPFRRAGAGTAGVNLTGTVNGSANQPILNGRRVVNPATQGNPGFCSGLCGWGDPGGGGHIIDRPIDLDPGDGSIIDFPVNGGGGNVWLPCGPATGCWLATTGQAGTGNWEQWVFNGTLRVFARIIDETHLNTASVTFNTGWGTNINMPEFAAPTVPAPNPRTLRRGQNALQNQINALHTEVLGDRPGYTFTGWFDASGHRVTYANGNFPVRNNTTGGTVSNLLNNVGQWHETGDHTITARWEAQRAANTIFIMDATTTPDGFGGTSFVNNTIQHAPPFGSNVSITNRLPGASAMQPIPGLEFLGWLNNGILVSNASGDPIAAAVGRVTINQPDQRWTISEQVTNPLVASWRILDTTVNLQLTNTWETWDFGSNVWHDSNGQITNARLLAARGGNHWGPSDLGIWSGAGVPIAVVTPQNPNPIQQLPNRLANDQLTLIWGQTTSFPGTPLPTPSIGMDIVNNQWVPLAPFGYRFDGWFIDRQGPNHQFGPHSFPNYGRITDANGNFVTNPTDPNVSVGNFLTRENNVTFWSHTGTTPVSIYPRWVPVDNTVTITFNVNWRIIDPVTRDPFPNVMQNAPATPVQQQFRWGARSFGPGTNTGWNMNERISRLDGGVYVFVGWALNDRAIPSEVIVNSDGWLRAGSHGNAAVNHQWTGTNVTLYAVWELVTSTVSFDINYDERNTSIVRPPNHGHEQIRVSDTNPAMTGLTTSQVTNLPSMQVPVGAIARVSPAGAATVDLPRLPTPNFVGDGEVGNYQFEGWFTSDILETGTHGNAADYGFVRGNRSVNMDRNWFDRGRSLLIVTDHEAAGVLRNTNDARTLPGRVTNADGSMYVGISNNLFRTYTSTVLVGGTPTSVTFTAWTFPENITLYAVWAIRISLVEGPEDKWGPTITDRFVQYENRDIEGWPGGSTNMLAMSGQELRWDAWVHETAVRGAPPQSCPPGCDCLSLGVQFRNSIDCIFYGAAEEVTITRIGAVPVGDRVLFQLRMVFVQGDVFTDIHWERFNELFDKSRIIIEKNIIHPETLTTTQVNAFVRESSQNPIVGPAITPDVFADGWEFGGWFDSDVNANGFGDTGRITNANGTPVNNFTGWITGGIWNTFADEPNPLSVYARWTGRQISLTYQDYDGQNFDLQDFTNVTEYVRHNSGQASGGTVNTQWIEDHRRATGNGWVDFQGRQFNASEMTSFMEFAGWRVAGTTALRTNASGNPINAVDEGNRWDWAEGGVDHNITLRDDWRGVHINFVFHDVNGQQITTVPVRYGQIFDLENAGSGNDHLMTNIQQAAIAGAMTDVRGHAFTGWRIGSMAGNLLPQNILQQTFPVRVTGFPALSSVNRTVNLFADVEPYRVEYLRTSSCGRIAQLDPWTSFFGTRTFSATYGEQFSFENATVDGSGAPATFIIHAGTGFYFDGWDFLRPGTVNDYVHVANANGSFTSDAIGFIVDASGNWILPLNEGTTIQFRVRWRAHQINIVLDFNMTWRTTEPTSYFTYDPDTDLLLSRIWENGDWVLPIEHGTPVNNTIDTLSLGAVPYAAALNTSNWTTFEHLFNGVEIPRGADQGDYRERLRFAGWQIVRGEGYVMNTTVSPAVPLVLTSARNLMISDGYLISGGSRELRLRAQWEPIVPPTDGAVKAPPTNRLSAPLMATASFSGVTPTSGTIVRPPNFPTDAPLWTWPPRGFETIDQLVGNLNEEELNEVRALVPTGHHLTGIWTTFYGNAYGDNTLIWNAQGHGQITFYDYDHALFWHSVFEDPFFIAFAPNVTNVTFHGLASDDDLTIIRPGVQSRNLTFNLPLGFGNNDIPIAVGQKFLGFFTATGDKILNPDLSFHITETTQSNLWLKDHTGALRLYAHFEPGEFTFEFSGFRPTDTSTNLIFQGDGDTLSLTRYIGDAASRVAVNRNGDITVGGTLSGQNLELTTESSAAGFNMLNTGIGSVVVIFGEEGQGGVILPKFENFTASGNWYSHVGWAAMVINHAGESVVGMVTSAGDDGVFVLSSWMLVSGTVVLHPIWGEPDTGNITFVMNNSAASTPSTPWSITFGVDSGGVAVTRTHTDGEAGRATFITAVTEQNTVFARIIPTVSKEGHIHTGWQARNNPTDAWRSFEFSATSGDEIHAGMEIRAMWDIRQYSVVLNFNDNRGIQAPTTKSYGALVQDAESLTPGLRFGGWEVYGTAGDIVGRWNGLDVEVDDIINRVPAMTNPSDVLTLRAIWLNNPFRIVIRINQADIGRLNIADPRFGNATGVVREVSEQVQYGVNLTDAAGVVNAAFEDFFNVSLRTGSIDDPLGLNVHHEMVWNRVFQENGVDIPNSSAPRLPYDSPFSGLYSTTGYSMPSNDIIFNVAIVPMSFEFTVDFNGGTSTMRPGYGYMETEATNLGLMAHLTVVGNSLTKGGHNLVGWTTERNSQADADRVGHIDGFPGFPSNWDPMVDSITFYALWQVRIPTLTIMHGMGEGIPYTERGIEYNHLMNLVAPTQLAGGSGAPSSRGHRFMGFMDVGTGLQFELTRMPDRNVTLVPIWEVDVTFNRNSPHAITGMPTINSITFVYGMTGTGPWTGRLGDKLGADPEMQNGLYDFDGWSLTPTGERLQTVTAFTPTTFRDDNGLTLYARWIRSVPNVDLYSGGGYYRITGESGQNLLSQILTEAILEARIPTPDAGYVFIGWRNESGARIISFANGVHNFLVNPSIADGDVLRLYPVFERRFTIEFHENGVEFRTITLALGAAFPSNILNLHDRTALGYKFLGWTLHGFAWTMPTHVPDFAMTGTVIIEGTWERIPVTHTIRFVANGNDFVAPATINHGNLITAPTTSPSGAGEHVGWRCQETGQTLHSHSVATRNQTFVPVFGDLNVLNSNTIILNNVYGFPFPTVQTSGNHRPFIPGTDIMMFLPRITTPAGVTHIGWTMQLGGQGTTVEFIPSIHSNMITQGTIFTAIYANDGDATRQVIFLNYNHSEILTVTAFVGAQLWTIAPATPVRSGHIFTGWDTMQTVVSPTPATTWTLTAQFIRVEGSWGGDGIPLLPIILLLFCILLGLILFIIIKRRKGKPAGNLAITNVKSERHSI